MAVECQVLVAQAKFKQIQSCVMESSGLGAWIRRHKWPTSPEQPVVNPFDDVSAEALALISEKLLYNTVSSVAFVSSCNRLRDALLNVPVIWPLRPACKAYGSVLVSHIALFLTQMILPH